MPAALHYKLLPAGSQPLSGLDLQDTWSAAGLAASASAAQLKPKLSMRPITTHVNVLLAGSSHYLGKAPYYAEDASVPSAEHSGEATSPASDKTTPPPADGPSEAKASIAGADGDAAATASGPIDLHGMFLEDPAAWATQLPPVLMPEACREMVYRFQVGPGGACCCYCFVADVASLHLPIWQGPWSSAAAALLASLLR